jgi:hypothetical protein
MTDSNAAIAFGSQIEKPRRDLMGGDVLEAGDKRFVRQILQGKLGGRDLSGSLPERENLIRW